MRTYFRSLNEVLASPLAQSAQTFHQKSVGGHRMLKSTKLEDAAYRDLRRDDNELDALEKACGEKLSTFSALSRDIYQSFYSLNVRRQPEDSISEQARRFNGPILDEVMGGEDYPAIKAACEGRQIPAYEAAAEFIGQVAGNLDSLLEKASGEKRALNTLERLEQRCASSMEALQKLLKEVAQAGPEQLPDLEQKAVKAANQAQSQVNQAEAVSRMVRDQMLQNKDAISACIAQAGRAAAEKAESVSSVLLAWGYGPDSHEPEQRAADMELVARVNQSSVLMEVARYLGRLKELMDGKRKNGYAYGRGEKYTLVGLVSAGVVVLARDTLPLERAVRRQRPGAGSVHQRAVGIQNGILDRVIRCIGCGAECCVRDVCQGAGDLISPFRQAAQHCIRPVCQRLQHTGTARQQQGAEQAA